MDVYVVVCLKRKVLCLECKWLVVWEILLDYQIEDCFNVIMECLLSCGELFLRYVDYKMIYLKIDEEVF